MAMHNDGLASCTFRAKTLHGRRGSRCKTFIQGQKTAHTLAYSRTRLGARRFFRRRAAVFSPARRRRAAWDIRPTSAIIVKTFRTRSSRRELLEVNISIQTRLFGSMMALLLVVVATATALSAYFAVHRVNEQRAAEIQRVMDTLSNANYPITQPVLQQVKGLCGAEFVFTQEDNRAQHATIDVPPDLLVQLQATPPGTDGALFDHSHVLSCEGREYFVGSTSLMRGGRLYALFPRRAWWVIALETTWPIWLSGALIVLAAAFLAAHLARLFGSPIRALQLQAEAIADGCYEPIALPDHRDEIRELAVGINQMAARLEQHDHEIRKAEHLAALSQLGAGVAHQLRNCATGARMAIELCDASAMKANDAKSMELALRQLQLLETHIQRFLTLGQSSVRPHQQVALGPLIQRVRGLVEPGCVHRDIVVQWPQTDDSFALSGDEESLTQLLTNLIANASDSAGGNEKTDRRVIVSLQATGADAAVRIDIADNGPGPSEDIAAEMFEPFVTTKPEGAGLGLYLTKRIAQDHGGSLTWRRENEWTHFVVELPTLRTLEPSE